MENNFEISKKQLINDIKISLAFNPHIVTIRAMSKNQSISNDDRVISYCVDAVIQYIRQSDYEETVKCAVMKEMIGELIPTSKAKTR